MGCALVAALEPSLGEAQYAVGGTSTQTRIDFAKVDRARILAAAATALGRTIAPTSDAESDSFLQMTLDLPALAAATQIDSSREADYRAKAHQTMLAWFGTRNGLKIEISGFEGLLPLCQLAEVAVGIPFLALPDTLASAVHRWFKGYLGYLTTDETAGLARDARDRHGCSWLLQVAAYAKLLGDDETLQAARVRYRHATLRAELNADGFFSQDLRSADPFRYSLMDLDMLAGVCTLLSTRFESLWDAELQDGPGMRGAIARHAPYIAKPIAWPYPADTEHFMELPGRRPALAFAARAYAQPEYASLFLTLYETVVPDLLRATPIRQPLLWLATPRRSATV
jgi:hypothetical protein